METRRLGRDGPEISVVGYGAWEIGGAWGPNPPEDQIFEAINAGIDAGMNWVDTAEVYGRGKSEELVGRALVARDDVFVFTKVAPQPVGTGFRKEQVREAAEKSLKRLGRDVIDLYQLHWPDAQVPVEETWEAMAELAADGIVRYIGVSNFDVALIERCEKIRHVDSLQPQFNLLQRAPADELLPFCARNGTGVIAYGPLAYGLLTGTITADTTFADDDWRAGKLGMGNYEKLFKPGVREQHLAKVDALRPIAERLGAKLAQLALAWVFHHPGVTGAIAGSRSPAHTVDNARAGAITLSAEDLAAVERALA